MSKDHHKGFVEVVMPTKYIWMLISAFSIAGEARAIGDVVNEKPCFKDTPTLQVALGIVYIPASTNIVTLEGSE